MNISDLTKMQQEPVSVKKGVPQKTISWRNNKNICKSASQIFQLTLRERVTP
jgi:hypothetical protein